MARLAVIPGSRPRLPRAAVAEHAVEVQVAIRDVQRATAPLWEAAFRTGDSDLMAEAKALDATLRAAMAQARVIAALAEPPDVPAERVAA